MKTKTKKQRAAYNEYLRVYMLKRYHDRHAWAVTHLGGKCVDCGSIEGLQFDHVDPQTKSFTLGNRLHTAPIAEVERELGKCVLRCRPCHVAKTVRQSENVSRHRNTVFTCACGRRLTGLNSYAGHKRWCGT